MADGWTGQEHHFNEQLWHTETLTKLEFYESEYRRLKETTSILELALWKIKLDGVSTEQVQSMSGGNEKIKMDPSEYRLQCRTNQLWS